jgi:Xaa-Pro aminopeptidase
MPSRRTFLAHSVAGLCTVSAAADAAGGGSAPALSAPPTLPDLDFARREPFLDRDRAAHVLAAEGLDALVVGQATNVFHATNFYPLMDRMSFRLSALAVVPRDPKRPVAIVVPSFTYYYIEADDGLVPGVQPFVFTAPVGYRDPLQGAPDEAATPATFAIADAAALTPRERQRRAALAAAAPYAPDMTRALARACRDLGVERGRLGFDDAGVAALLATAAPQATALAADDTPRRLRFVRTPAEIRMMRIAAQNNVDAALATIRAARSLGSLAAVRQRFYAEAALRGNLGVFMVVDSVSSEAHDEKLVDGRAFMVDCVSHCRNFHGDYGRTVFLGEPPARMKRCVDGITAMWGELRPRLKPGVRFSAIRTQGAEILRSLGYDVPVLFNPHSVGLAHNDQPRTAPGGGPVDHVLEAGMILSVDCPLFETGNGGTAHFEDLVLITPSGGEPIHSTAPAAITV